MADTQKKVVITGDASSLVNALDQSSAAGSRLYDQLMRKAQAYSDDLRVQKQYIESILNVQQKRNQIEQQSLHSRIGAEAQEAMFHAAGRERPGIKDYYAGIEARVREELRGESAEISGARQRVRLNIYERLRAIERGKYQAQGYDEEERTAGRHRRFFRRGGAAEEAAAATSRALGFGSGIGFGFAFGISGMIYTMIHNADQLQRSMMLLKSTMGEVSTASEQAAWNIGLSAAQMAELTTTVAKASGGIYGRGTSTQTLQLAQYARAFGLDQNSLMGLMPLERMTTNRMSMDQLMTLLIDRMNNSGAINIMNKNFAQLGEKLDYWIKLSNLQSGQMLNANPTSALGVLYAFQKTGAPVFSDQRQLQLIQGLNNVIRNPSNDYIRAFMYQALAPRAGNDLIGTMVRQEQGIFGAHNLQDVLSSLKSMYGGNKTGMALALESLLRTGGVAQPMQTALTMQNLMNNPTKYNEFMNDLNVYSNPNATPQQVEAARKRMAAAGVNVPQRAQDMTAATQKLTAELTNIMANMGSPLLNEFSKILGAPGTQEMMNKSVSVASLVASQTFATAVDIFKKSVDVLWSILPHVGGSGIDVAGPSPLSSPAAMRAWAQKAYPGKYPSLNAAGHYTVDALRKKGLLGGNTFSIGGFNEGQLERAQKSGSDFFVGNVGDFWHPVMDTVWIKDMTDSLKENTHALRDSTAAHGKNATDRTPYHSERR